VVLIVSPEIELSALFTTKRNSPDFDTTTPLGLAPVANSELAMAASAPLVQSMLNPDRVRVTIRGVQKLSVGSCGDKVWDFTRGKWRARDGRQRPGGWIDSIPRNTMTKEICAIKEF
jgi:hypothetical protein